MRSKIFFCLFFGNHFGPKIRQGRTFLQTSMGRFWIKICDIPPTPTTPKNQINLGDFGDVFLRCFFGFLKKLKKYFLNWVEDIEIELGRRY